MACEVALEAAYGLPLSLSLRSLAFEVGAGLGVDPGAGDRDDVQCAVELAIPTTVQAMAVFAPGGHGYRCHPGLAGKVSVGGESLGAGGASDQRRGGQRAATTLSEQSWPVFLDERGQLALQGVCLTGDLRMLLTSSRATRVRAVRSHCAGDERYGQASRRCRACARGSSPRGPDRDRPGANATG